MTAMEWKRRLGCSPSALRGSWVVARVISPLSIVTSLVTLIATTHASTSLPGFKCNHFCTLCTLEMNGGPWWGSSGSGFVRILPHPHDADENPPAHLTPKRATQNPKPSIIPAGRLTARRRPPGRVRRPCPCLELWRRARVEANSGL